MQPLSKYNQDITFLFVAVDTLSRFLWALALRGKKSAACNQTNIAGVRSGHKDCPPKHYRDPNALSLEPEKTWVDKEREFVRELSSFCQQSGLNNYSFFDLQRNEKGVAC